MTTLPLRRTTRTVVEWNCRVGSRPASPAAHHRARVWEPFEGSHLNRGFILRSLARFQQGARVGAIVDGHQVIDVDLSVALGGAQAGMAEQFLD